LRVKIKSAENEKIHLKRLLSKTTELILIKLGRKYLQGMGIKVCANQGTGPFWWPAGGYNRGKFGNLKSISLTNQ